MKQEEKMLLGRLKQALNPDLKTTVIIDECRERELSQIFETAKRHTVLPLLFDVYEDDSHVAEGYGEVLRQSAVVTVRSNYRLLFLTKYITQLLEKEGICAILLKGAATASYYPVPELRKSGDVDILIPREESFQRAVELLKKEGFIECEDQFTQHHIELKNDEGISVEVHSILAEPFESRKMNQYLETLLLAYEEHVIQNDSWGITIYQPGDAYHAFYLVVHMLQHFLRAGFGLKFLCDWTVFWNREVAEEEKETFLCLVKESGTKGFVTVLTKACMEYLGLREQSAGFLLEKSELPGETDLKRLAEEFMEEVFAGGEFGHDDRQRMVAMRGTGITAYIREFHHQMHLNYPKVGNIFLLWPLLWLLTLWRFLHNNRAIRKVKGWDILKEAGRRSRLIDRMKLFS